MRTPRRLPTTLALLVALVAAPGHAQDTEEGCPNPIGWRPSPEELQARLEAHAKWIKDGGPW